MKTGIIHDLQDLTYLRWSHIRNSSGTAGTFLKSGSILNSVKRYYKLSNFDPVEGVIGHECVNKIIVDRLLTLLGIPHLVRNNILDTSGPAMSFCAAVRTLRTWWEKANLLPSGKK